MKRSLFLLYWCASLFVACGPKPWNPEKGFDRPEQAPQLDEPWDAYLSFLPDTRNKKLLQGNIRKLPLADRQALLDTIKSIQATDQKKVFLESLSLFQDADQANLMRIIVHLKNVDQKLVYKILNCSHCLSLLEELRLLKITSSLPEKCQALLNRFAMEFNHQTG
jgi:hypothetical protein